MSERAIVIGGGVGERVAAHYLKRAGYDVVVLDDYPGGATCSTDAGWVPPHIVRDLALDRHGFAADTGDAWLTVALPDGGRLALSRDVARSAAAIAKVSARDARQWPEFCARMARLATLMESIYCAAPPDPLAHSFGELAHLTRFALRTRGLGRTGLDDLLRILPMSIADLLDEWFESDALKGALGAAGVMHLSQGPRSGGTAFNFLHHHVGSVAGVFQIQRSNAHETLGKLPGISRRAASVARIAIEGGRVTGVTLRSGEEIPGALVVSGLDPRRTLTEQIDVAWLDPQLVRALRRVRGRGVAARMTFTLERPAPFATLRFAPSLDYVERAYDDVKYQRISRAPWVDARRAERGGRHFLDVHAQYVPHRLEASAAEAARGAIGEYVVATLQRELPELAIVGREVSLPQDLESACGYPQGQPYHAEIALDQVLWMRPVPELARYRTPIGGLYLCGPGMHPGIAAVAGANAAKTILRDRGR